MTHIWISGLVHAMACRFFSAKPLLLIQCHHHRNGKVVRMIVLVVTGGRWTSPVTIKAVILTTFHFQWLEALNVVKSTVFISSDGMKAIDVATGVVWGRSCAKLMHVYTMGISLRERDVYHTERHLPYIYTKQHPLGIVLDMYFYTIFSKCLVGYIGRQFLWWGYWGQ